MSLLNNSANSIRLGLGDYAQDEDDRLVSAVRNIHAGILLMYKEKLRRLSPAESNEVLIKQKILPEIDNEGQLVFVGQGRKTVDVQGIKERFSSLGVSVTWARFDAIGRIRNEIEHYYSASGRDAVKGAITASFILIREFLREHLNEDPINVLGAEAWQQMTEIAEVFEAERQECLASIRAHDWSTASLGDAAEDYLCGDCGSALVEPVSDERQCDMRCRSCGHVEKFESFALEAIREALVDHRDLKHGGSMKLVNCPNCGEEAYDIEEQMCVICEESVSHECSFCGSRIEPEELDDDGLCGWCRNRSMKDD